MSLVSPGKVLDCHFLLTLIRLMTVSQSRRKQTQIKNHRSICGSDPELLTNSELRVDFVTCGIKQEIYPHSCWSARQQQWSCDLPTGADCTFFSFACLQLSCVFCCLVQHQFIIRADFSSSFLSESYLYILFSLNSISCYSEVLWVLSWLLYWEYLFSALLQTECLNQEMQTTACLLTDCVDS